MRIFAPPFILSAFIISASGCGPFAAHSGNVEVASAELQHSGPDKLLLRINVANGTYATVYVYDSVRTVGFDEDAKQVTLRLRDRPWVTTGGSADCHLLIPSYRSIAPLEVDTFEIKIPRAYHQLELPSRGSDGSLSMREIPVAEAKQVTAEIAWSDRPFTINSGRLCSRELADAMIALERGVASSEVKRP